MAISVEGRIVSSQAFVFGLGLSDQYEYLGLYNVYHGQSHFISEIFPKAVLPEDPRRILYRVGGYFPEFTKPWEFVANAAITKRLSLVSTIQSEPVHMGTPIKCSKAKSIIETMNNDPVGAISIEFSKAMVYDNKRLSKYNSVRWDEMEYVPDRFWVRGMSVFDIPQLNWTKGQFLRGNEESIEEIAAKFAGRVPASVIDQFGAVQCGGIWLVSEEFMKVVDAHVPAELFVLRGVQLTQ